MLACFLIRRKLGDYLDGALGGEEEARIRGHLSRCGRCARLSSDLGALVQAARRTRGPAVDEAFWKRFDAGLMRKLNNAIEKEAALSRRSVFSFFSLLPRTALVAVSVALIVLTAGQRFFPSVRAMFHGRIAADETGSLVDEQQMLDEFSRANGAAEVSEDDALAELEMFYFLDPASLEDI